MTQCNTVPGNAVTGMTAHCRYCTHCNVQTGMGWAPVFFCERDGHATAVSDSDSCGKFEREPGSDDA